MTKFFDKSKMPDKIVAYEYMEDTKLPFIKKITSMSRFSGNYVRFIALPIKDKKDKSIISYPKFYDHSGCLDSTWGDSWEMSIKSGSYFKHNDTVYWVSNGSLGKVTNFDSMGDALKAALGIIDTNMNEVFEFLSFLEHKGTTLHVIGQYNLVAVFDCGRVWEMGRVGHDFYLNDFVDIVTHAVDTKKLTKDVLIKNYSKLEEFANSYGKFHDNMRQEYEDFKANRKRAESV